MPRLDSTSIILTHTVTIYRIVDGNNKGDPLLTCNVPRTTQSEGKHARLTEK
jgi:hypothetical protein